MTLHRCALLALCLSAPAVAQSPVSDAVTLAFRNGPDRVPLRVDGARLGLRFDPALGEAEVRALLGALPAVAPGQDVAAWIHPGATVFVDTAPGTTPAQALAAAAAIRQVDGVWSASPRLWALEDPYYLTEELLVRWKPAADAAAVLELTEGLTQTGALAYSTNPGAVYRVPPGADPLAIANRIAESGAAEFALPDFQLLRVPHGAGTDDPLFPQQWHLETTGAMGTVPDADVDAAGAWALTRGSEDVTIAVIDTGVELGHPDLVANLVQGIDVLEDDNVPQAEDYFFGLFPENHSTSVCGVAAGTGDNALGVSGVAQRCKIMPIRFLSEWFLLQPTVQDEADAFNFARQNGADVVNNSWGPTAAAPLPASTKAAIDDCNQNGRGGLGMVIFFAAGNSGADNSSNGYASYAGVLGVTAVTDQELLAGYSSFGPSVDCCAPSNGGVNGITTTDRLGSVGYSNGDYTDGFGGTSSASPCAAGVMLLVLSQNPALTRAQAIDVLLGTTDVVDPAGGAYGPDGHSDLYGFGRVNAAAAVAAAGGVVDTCAIASYCVTSPNSAGAGATIGASGSASVAANDLVLAVAGAAPSQNGIFYYGDQTAQAPFGDGVRCAAGALIRLPVLQTDPAGAASWALDLTALPPGGELGAGDRRYFQFWYRDPAFGGSGFNLSDGLDVTFCD